MKKLDVKTSISFSLSLRGAHATKQSSLSFVVIPAKAGVFWIASLTLAMTLAIASPALADCTTPDSPPGGLAYFSADDTYKFCDANDVWVDLLDGGSATAAGPDRSIQFNNASAFDGDANFVYTATGRLGVGTSSPEGLLHLSSSASGATGPRLLLDNTAGAATGNAAEIAFLTDSGATGSSYNANIAALQDGSGTGHTAITFGTYAGSTAPAERMRIAASGNVGIGTASPAAALDVKGLNTSDSNSIILRNGDTSGGDNETTQIRFGYANTNGYPQWITTRHNGNPTNNAIDFYTGDGTQAGVFPTNAIHGMTVTEGKVGIGTTTPTSKLDILNTSRQRAEVESTNNTYHWWKNSTPSKAVAIGMNRPGIGALGDDLVFSTYDGSSWAERARILNSSGNVGIGTASPTAKFMVHLDSDKNIATQLLSGESQIFSVNDANSAYQPFYIDGSTVILQTSSGGTVGINDTSPDSGTGGQLLLDVEGHIGGTAYCDENGDNCVAPADLASGVAAGPDRSIQFNNASSFDGDANFVYDADGEVGIGVANPDAKLEIAGEGSDTLKIGSAGFGSYTGMSFNGALSTTDYNILSGAGDKHLYINRPTGSNIRLRENNTDQMVIEAGGNVGIGTADPASKLDVIGTVATTANGATSYMGSNAVWWNGFNSGATAGTWGFVQQNYAAGVGSDVYSRGFTANAMGIFNSSTTAEDIYLYNRNSDEANFLVVKDSGNVGIDTAAPDGKLSVKASGTGTGKAFLITDSNDDEKVIINDNGNVQINTGPIMGQTYTGPGGNGLNITSSDGGGAFFSFDINHAIFFRQGNDSVGNTNSYYQYGGTLADGRGHRFFTGGMIEDQDLKLQIADDGIYSSVKVGIGTNAPAAPLQVMGSSHQNLILDTASGTDQVRHTFRRQGSDKVISLLASDNSFATSSIGATDLGFSTNNGSGAIFMLKGGGDGYYTGGKFGIGTTSPAGKLSVVGSDSATHGTNAAVLIENTASGGGGWSFRVGATGTHTPAAGLSIADANDYRMVIDSSGRVGIAMVNPSVALDVNGDIEYTGTITDVSDKRLKKDIKPLDKNDIVNRLNKIDTYSFRMKDGKDNQLEMGVMAQEIKEIFPELVRTADDDMGTMSVNYVGFIAPLIEASKDLKSENEALKAEISALKANQADLKEALNEINNNLKGLNIHTGYGIGKAEMSLLMVLAALGVLGGAAAVRQRKSTISKN